MTNTIPDKEWRSLRDRAIRHEIEHEGGMFGDAAIRRRRATDPAKADTN
jgi:hypothetical protein